MQGSPEASGTEKHSATNWNAIDWHQQERRVRNLRQRIFRATQAGDWKRVRSRAIRSCCAAVRTAW
jgi:RNA-directed DNA polymerase